MELLKEITEFIYDGAMDYRVVEAEFAKMNPDSADVSSPKKKKEDDDDKWKKRIALGTNTIGVVAAPAAIGATLKDPRLKSSSSTEKMKSARGLPLKGASKIKGLKGIASNRKVMAAGAVGAVGLQTGNAAGDAISAKYFADEEKKNKKDIKKMLDARREGKVTTEEVIKFAGRKAKEIKRLRQIVTDERAAKTTDAGKKTVLVGTGIIGAGLGGYGLKRAQQKEINPKIPKMRMEEALDKPLVVKSDMQWDGQISKVDEDKRQVFGWCSLTKVDGEDVVDRQGDYIPLEEVEKSAYNYVISSRKGGDMHKRDGDQALHTADMIESFVVTPEKLEKLGLPEDAMPQGWWVGFKVNDDEQWEGIKKGDRGFFSIHGKGKRKARHGA